MGDTVTGQGQQEKQTRTDGVSLEARYAAAWDEIHTRVEARQSIRIHFAVVAVGSAVAALSNLTRADWLAAWTLGLALSMPFLTWAFALWTRHADLMIGLISRYCAACESIGDETNTSGLPGFSRGDQGWMAEARRLGRYSDAADILLVVLTSFPALGLLIGYRFAPASAVPAWLPAGLLVAQLSAAVFIWRKRGQRQRIAGLQFQQRGGTWSIHSR